MRNQNLCLWIDRKNWTTYETFDITGAMKNLTYTSNLITIKGSSSSSSTFTEIDLLVYLFQLLFFNRKKIRVLWNGEQKTNACNGNEYWSIELDIVTECRFEMRDARYYWAEQLLPLLDTLTTHTHQYTHSHTQIHIHSLISL